MDVTHLLHVFPTFTVGGSQVRFARLAEAHGPRYRHSIIALDGVSDMVGRIASSVALTLVPFSYDKRAGLRNLPLLRHTLQSTAPDALVTYNWGSIEWALANRFRRVARHIHIEDGFGPEESAGQIQRRVWMRRLALSGEHSRTVLPSRQLERLAHDHWRLPASRLEYLPNGIDCDRFAVPARREFPSPDKRPIVIGTVATLRREKNLERLIRAVAALARESAMPALRLEIHGDGPERASLEATIKSEAADTIIRLAGATRTPETAHAGFDIFALSSDTEQMPLSVLEAMASGLPIASVAVGDVADMVSSENRPFVTPASDEAAFRMSLRRLLNEPALRGTLGCANARAARDRFDETVMITRWREVFG